MSERALWIVDEGSPAHLRRLAVERSLRAQVQQVVTAFLQQPESEPVITMEPHRPSMERKRRRSKALRTGGK